MYVNIVRHRQIFLTELNKYFKWHDCKGHEKCVKILHMPLLMIALAVVLSVKTVIC